MIRVLLIDDCDEVRETMRMLSERAGFETLEARDGLAGLQRAVEDEPDLVLVKAELPGLDGFDLQARL
ncbi:MAG TPA: response regulator, partial [Myxococcota bacterium]|nr:response regulator [Myxococcota bacterium]